MTENQFRGRRIDNGEWVYGAYYEHLPPLQCFGEDTEKSKHYILKTAFADWNMPRSVTFIEVAQDGIGRYTETKDKNDTKIYEGDILLLNNGKKAQVVYQIGDKAIGFYLQSLRVPCTSYDWSDFYRINIQNGYDLEVIGNIY